MVILICETADQVAVKEGKDAGDGIHHVAKIDREGDTLWLLVD
ncbi:hypothetical protein WGT02_28295 (plasmid) [Rhizobium sp. T1470]|nr:hypothetical protein [Rhizobium sp. T1473]